MDLSRLLLALPGQLGTQGRLMVRDPKRFLKNIDFALHPDKLRRSLLGLEQMTPMHVRIEPALAATPHLNVLLPRLGVASLTGGPNTAINIACGLAALGTPVRLLAMDEARPADTDALWRHVTAVAGTGDVRPNIEFGSTADPAEPAAVGEQDVFLATYWTTAYRLKSVLPGMAVREFIYLVQDFEPGFYAWSSSHAQALETYSMRFRALVNEQLLADYLVQTATGRFAEPGFMSSCAVFEPAVDRLLFHPVARDGGPRQLLFYARPSRPRNLFGIGFEALCAASRHPAFARDDWKFVSMGDSSLGRMELGGGRVLEPAPWLNFEAYARLIRQSDILLCPMLSPHTSYPVLEMAACRGVAVTNVFGSKTQLRLQAISPNIIAEPADIEALGRGLVTAAERLSAAPDSDGGLDLPSDWPTALRGTVAAAREMFEQAVGAAGTGH